MTELAKRIPQLIGCAACAYLAVTVNPAWILILVGVAMVLEP